MLKNRKWIISGGVAVCVLVGSAMLNDAPVQAQVAIKKKESSNTEAKKKTPKEQAKALMKKWDKNGDGAVTEKESNKPFMRIDKNKDGKVDLKEMEEFYKGMSGASGARIMRPVSKKDVEKAKKEAADRKAAADKKAKEDAKKKADDLFGKADKNADGTLDKGEAKKALGEEADGWMKKLDSDGDGKVTRKEAEDYFGKESAKQREGSNARSSGGQGRIIGGIAPSGSAEGSAKKKQGESSTNNKKDK
jgi:colicin import membrane protein